MNDPVPLVDTLSEAVLSLAPEERPRLQLPIPYWCTEDGAFIPATFVEGGKGRKSADIGLRVEIMGETAMTAMLAGQPTEEVDHLFPPSGPAGYWDPRERFFRSRYNVEAARGEIGLPPDVAEANGVRDYFSYCLAVLRGDVVPFQSTSITVRPSSPERICRVEIDVKGRRIPIRIALCYRGCPRVYQHPFQPSAARQFMDVEAAKPFRALKRFVSNLVIELVWFTWQRPLTVQETAAIVQHYKVLPWSGMIDVTHDVNIAKAFASLEASQGPRTPALYKVALLGIGCFERGAQSLCDPELGPRFQLCLSEKGRPVVLPLTDLPFRRPKVQRAASVLGLTADMGDPDGTVVALTEHPFYVTEHGSSWDAFGGPGFALGERRFESVFLDNVDSKELTRLLYPSESRTVASMFNLICDKVEQHLASFGLASEDEAAVAARLRGLREEMALATD